MKHDEERVWEERGPLPDNWVPLSWLRSGRQSLWSPPVPDGPWWEQARTWSPPHATATCGCGVTWRAMTKTTAEAMRRLHWMGRGAFDKTEQCG